MQITPAVHLGWVLRECCQRGYEFDKAWEVAMRSLPRGPDQDLTEWKSALRWAKSNFREAYATRSLVCGMVAVSASSLREATVS